MKSGGCARLGEWLFLIVRYPSPWPNHMSLVFYLDNHTWWFGAARFARKSIPRPSICGCGSCLCESSLCPKPSSYNMLGILLLTTSVDLCNILQSHNIHMNANCNFALFMVLCSPHTHHMSVCSKPCFVRLLTNQLTEPGWRWTMGRQQRVVTNRGRRSTIFRSRTLAPTTIKRFCHPAAQTPTNCTGESGSPPLPRKAKSNEIIEKPDSFSQGGFSSIALTSSNMMRAGLGGKK